MQMEKKAEQNVMQRIKAEHPTESQSQVLEIMTLENKGA
jgi:hypothetical protein